VNTKRWLKSGLPVYGFGKFFTRSTLTPSSTLSNSFDPKKKQTNKQTETPFELASISSQILSEAFRASNESIQTRFQASRESIRARSPGFRGNRSKLILKLPRNASEPNSRLPRNRSKLIPKL
jgi:hypothetical protein